MSICLPEIADPRERLPSLGFRQVGRSRFQRRGLTVAPGRDFWTISAPAAGERSCLEGQLGRLGLWKLVGQEGGELAWEFHLPSSLAQMASDYEQPDDNLLDACLAWAEATFVGELHSAWRPPSMNQLEKWLGKDRLTVQAGPIVRQALVLCEGRRMAVRFPLVHQASGQLSAARRQWRHAVLAEAQNRWMMARVGYRDGRLAEQAMPAIGVELDLTGAPEAAIECLLKTGVDGLRWAVSWLLWPVGFLSDPSVTCSVWEIPPERAFGPEGNVQKGGTHA